MKKMKLLLLLSIAVNLTLLFIFAGRKLYYYYTSLGTDPSDTYNDARRSLLGKIPIDSTDIVFVGNSETQDFPVAEWMGQYRIKNRGISGNRLFHILTRIEGITSAHPKKLFLCAGINDILNDKPIDDIKAEYSNLIGLIRAQSPETALVIQSVPPLFRQNRAKDVKVAELNAWLEQYCNSEKIQFVNIYTGLKDNESNSYDGVHLTAQAYEYWFRAIEPYLVD